MLHSRDNHTNYTDSESFITCIDGRRTNPPVVADYSLNTNILIHIPHILMSSDTPKFAVTVIIY